MSGRVRALATAVLLIAWLRLPAVAGPPDPERDQDLPHDPKGAAGASPWIDLFPARVLAEHGTGSTAAPNHKLAASLTLAGFYGGFTTWTYFAWYRKHHPLSQFKWGGDGTWKLWDSNGWFGAKQYAGGADKLGHIWATYGLARGGTELLSQWGGFDRITSTIVGTSLSELLFFGVEVKDGFYYEFSYGDFTFDTIGAVLAVAMSLSPRLDELFDYRVQYWPSQAYVDQFEGGNINIAEDYTGQTYMLAFHLGGIHSLRDSTYGTWSRFVDLAVGFGTNGYKPEPALGSPKYVESQHGYIGISLNAQGLCDWLFEKRSRPAAKFFHGLWEMFNAPSGYLPFVNHENRPTGPVRPGGA